MFFKRVSRMFQGTFNGVLTLISMIYFQNYIGQSSPSVSSFLIGYVNFVFTWGLDLYMNSRNIKDTPIVFTLYPREFFEKLAIFAKIGNILDFAI